MKHKIYLLLLAVCFASQGLFAQHQKHTHSNGVKCGSDHLNEQFLLNNPEIAQKKRAFDKQISDLRKVGMIQSILNIDENTILEIPIVIHIMHLGETPGTGHNPSDQQIFDWINHANEVLAGTANGILGEGNGGTNIPIRLVLAKRTPECTSTNGIVRVNASGVPGYSQHGVHYSTTTGTGSAITGASHQDIRNLSRWDPESYFNIYVVNNISDDVYGFAYFPGTSIDIDGSFMRTVLVGTNNTTFAHEMGHAFGLYHTFQGASSSLDGCPPTETDCTLQGDQVCDTEIIKDLNPFSYNNYPDNTTINPCTGELYQGTQYNIMGYGAIKNRFSPGQREKALLDVLQYRGNLLNSLALYEPGADTPTISLVEACIPESAQYSGNNMGPVKVTFGDISAITNGNDGITAHYYNYANSCLVTGSTDIPGYEPTSLSVSTKFYQQNVRAYIDWNNNGIFEEATETVIGASNGNNIPAAGGTVTVNVTPHPFAIKGTALRMRVIADYFNGVSITPCYTPAYGQVEDYAVTVIETISGCDGISDEIIAQISQETAYAGDQLYLQASGVLGSDGVQYQWQKSTDGITGWTNIENTNAMLGIVIAEGAIGSKTFYRLKVTCITSEIDHFSDIVSYEIVPEYCAAGATSTSGYKINNVTFANITNNSTSTAGYEDFTHIITDVQVGNTYAFSASYPGTTSNWDYVYVWIDFNYDGDFDDEGELVLQTSGFSPWTGNITIPENVPLGERRMRIRLQYQLHSGYIGNHTPCGDSTAGQVEDYTVNLVDIGCSGISDNIIASVVSGSGAENSELTLTAEGVQGVQGISYQWQQNIEGISEWEDIENANSLTSSVAISGSIGQTINYRLKVTCITSEIEHFSNIVSYEIVPHYCVAGATSTQNHKIDNVTFANITNNSTSTAGYEDFTHIITGVQVGNTYAFSASYPGTTYGWDELFVWIDFNYDGDFDDEGELVLQTAGASPWTGNITIPENVSLGKRRMRVRMHYNQPNSNFTPNNTPCGNSTIGQVEDYTVNITDLGCSGISDNIIATVVSGSGAENSELILTAEGVQGVQGINYQWQKAINDINDWQDITNANTKNLTTTIDTSAGNVIYYRLKVVCTETQTAYYSNEITLPIYCVPTITSFRHESITGINVSDITYATTAIPTYYFSSSIAGNLTAGETYSFNATGNQNYPQDEIRVWVDFNNNGSFEDNGELLLIKAGATPWNGNIIIPGDVESGVTRMRVRLRYANSSDILTSCGDNVYGQIIDLMVNVHGIEGCNGISDNIVAYTSTSSTPNIITLGATGVVGTAQNVNYQWQQNITGTEWEDIENATTAISTVTIWADSGQTINYRLKVTCNETQEDYYSQSVSHLFILNYCSAGATNSTAYDVISNVTFAGINNNSTATIGYEDFSSIVGTVTQGETYPFFAQYNGYSQSMCQILVWIDFNNNGVFTPEERVLEISGASPWNGSITIPENITPGNRRMRIRLHYAQTGYNPNYTACGNTLYGQVEDYTINILPNLSNSCNITTTWNGSTWSNGNPDITKKAIIDGILVMNTDLSACELEVTENGKLTIPANRILTVKGQVINNATAADFVVANDAMLIQIDEAENQGAITVLRNSNPMKRLDYTLWSSPVEGMLLKNFSQVSNSGGTGTIWNRVYTLGQNAWEQVWNSFTEVETGSHTFGIGKGYLYRARNDYHSTNTVIFEGEFKGIPNNGNISISTPLSFNGIGNPYPSAIDADKFIGVNSGVNALYFWTNVNAPVDGNYTLNNWASYTQMGGTGIYLNGNQFYRPDGIILPGQGFVTETSSTQVSFNNTMRTADNGGFFRQMNTDRHRYWLNLADETVIYNQILVGYVENATQGVDTGIDAQMFGYEGNAIYSLIENSDKQFVIQGRQLPLTDTDVVPIGFRAVNAGNFTIALYNFDGLFAEGYTTIYLKDNFNGSFHNLNSGAYNFLSETGIFDNRFEIVYQTTMSIENPEPNNTDWMVYKQDKHFHIQTKGFELKEVWVYDILGRTLYKSDAENTSHVIPTLDVEGVFIVKVVTTQDKVLNKKVR